jgi:hypothetical protein
MSKAAFGNVAESFFLEGRSMKKVQLERWSLANDVASITFDSYHIVLITKH